MNSQKKFDFHYHSMEEMDYNWRYCVVKFFFLKFSLVIFFLLNVDNLFITFFTTRDLTMMIYILKQSPGPSLSGSINKICHRILKSGFRPKSMSKIVENDKGF